nr:cytochrome P450 82A2-like [Coffea arabica]
MVERFVNTVITDQVESSSSAHGSQKTVTISEEDYVKFLQYQASNHASLPSASLAQKADGSTTKVKGLGTVEVNPSLPLSSVLYDLKTKRTIGGGHEHNGLYFLNFNGPIACPAIVLIVAGTSTTSRALSWVISLLLNHRHVLQKAQEEIDFFVGKERWVEESDIKNLVYLQVKETMRLHPPAPVPMPRQADEDCNVALSWRSPNSQ